jgi:hypothetical protein
MKMTMMQNSVPYGSSNTNRYARCIDASKRIRWDIERDVIRGRRFDLSKRFLPDGLSRVDELAFLSPDEQRFLTQVQGRSYANIFGLVERFIAAKIVDVGRDYVLDDQVAFEALVRFTDEELKHQEMFRRIEAMIGEGMPAGYVFAPEPNAVANAVLSKSTWSVLGLTCHIELFTQLHYRESIDGEQHICPLWKDVFLYHWKEESQHAILDELEWVREDATLGKAERDAAVEDLIALVGAVDGILQAQAQADAEYFAAHCGRTLTEAQHFGVGASVLRAYRWQYIVSGVQDPRFGKILGGLIDAEQGARIQQALAPIVQSVNVQ